MLSESVLIAILAFIVIMCFDHRKWRKAMSAGFVETSIQATDHLAFIADCMDEQMENGPMPTVEGMPNLDLKSLLTQAFISKMSMPPPDSDGTQTQRQISEEENDTQTAQA